ncbi:MAG: DEAD/DEAH box helicase family protein [Tissierellales bacterium]|nr:DEAD/DEAH box helicase family protein [Tissierellales bacterium]
MTREEGNDKALIVAATGVGKTYLAAFDSKEYSSILFVAHREEILNQAYESFSEVRDDKYKFESSTAVGE